MRWGAHQSGPLHFVLKESNREKKEGVYSLFLRPKGYKTLRLVMRFLYPKVPAKEISSSWDETGSLPDLTIHQTTSSAETMTGEIYSAIEEIIGRPKSVLKTPQFWESQGYWQRDYSQTSSIGPLHALREWVHNQAMTWFSNLLKANDGAEAQLQVSEQPKLFEFNHKRPESLSVGGLPCTRTRDQPASNHHILTCILVL